MGEYLNNMAHIILGYALYALADKGYEYLYFFIGLFFLSWAMAFIGKKFFKYPPEEKIPIRIPFLFFLGDFVYFYFWVGFVFFFNILIFHSDPSGFSGYFLLNSGFGIFFVIGNLIWAKKMRKGKKENHGNLTANKGE